jgi:hypothetical protein
MEPLRCVSCCRSKDTAATASNIGPPNFAESGFWTKTTFQVRTNRRLLLAGAS